MVKVPPMGLGWRVNEVVLVQHLAQCLPLSKNPVNTVRIIVSIIIIQAKPFDGHPPPFPTYTPFSFSCPPLTHTHTHQVASDIIILLTIFSTLLTDKYHFFHLDTFPENYLAPDWCSHASLGPIPLKKAKCLACLLTYQLLFPKTKNSVYW